MTASSFYDESVIALPELEEAAAEFIAAAVQANPAATDPYYRQLVREQLPMPEGTTGVEVQAMSERIVSPDTRVTHAFVVERDWVLAGDFERFHTLVIEWGESFYVQMMRAFFDHVGEAAAAVGNSAEIRGLDWDSLFDQFEKVEWAVDAVGNVRPPEVHAGANVELPQKSDLTPEHIARWFEIVRAKQEGHVSRRRRRRLRS